MFGKSNKSKKTDLTSPENVAKGQAAYRRLERGMDVPAALDATYGRKTKKS